METTMTKRTSWFAWYPVPISVFDGTRFLRTGRWAWLREVRVRESNFGERFYD